MEPIEIIWRNGAYYVSIPNYKGGTVYDASVVKDLKRENEAMREALEPFAQTGWMTSDTEHTARTIVVHMHPESEREIILSSDDFRRAAAALASLKEPSK